MGSASSIQQTSRKAIESVARVVEESALGPVLRRKHHHDTKAQLAFKIQEPKVPANESVEEKRKILDRKLSTDKQQLHSHIKVHSWGKKAQAAQKEAGGQRMEDAVTAFIAKLKEDPKLQQEKLKLIRSPSFDVWQCRTEELVTYVIMMFEDLGVTSELNISVSRLKKWLVAVEQNYIRYVFFHNFRHAFCVTQMMYFIIHELELTKHMTILQLTILLVACICHDLDHPGLNNLYQTKAHTELSVLYHNHSALEHHHCAVAFQLLSANDLNIFTNLPEDQVDQVSHIVIQLILATDMAIHDRILEDFKMKLEAGFSLSNPEHLLALQKILIKCCDISNEVRPLDISKVWVDKLFKEFSAQADRERREGLPVEKFMQKTNMKKADDQLFFIRKIIMPLFECLGTVFPDVNGRILKSLRESELFYERMSADEIKQLMDSDSTMTKADGTPKFIIPTIALNQVQEEAQKTVAEK